MNYIILILGVLLAVAVGGNALQYRIHESYVIETTDKIARLESSNESLEKAKEILENKRVEDQRQIINLSGEMRVIYEENDRKQMLLDKYRSRETTVLAKPGLVSKLANSATKQLFRELNNITGGSFGIDNIPSSDADAPSDSVD